MRNKSICSASPIVRLSIGTSVPFHLHLGEPPTLRGSSSSFSAASQAYTLPVSQHVLDIAVVLGVQVLRELLLGQPLEVLEVLGVDREIGLAGHDTGLQEKDLAASSFGIGRLDLLGRVE